MEEQITSTPEFVEVVDIQFRPGQKIYFFDPAGLKCKPGDHVVIDTARGAEYGYCTGPNHRIPATKVVSPLRRVLRMANDQDEKAAAANREKEKKAFAICAQKIEEHQLDMQLISAKCSFDSTKILFFFTADERVDFRELVKDLGATLHARIELRQIGVRDKAKMVGGLGICGRPFCCATFLEDFQPVSIKMAKTQNLSLSPTKISGTCGRLMCCLKYEQDAYEDLIRSSPKNESFVDTPDGRGTVIEVDLLRQRVKVRMEEQTDTIGVYANTEIAILRNGKAKKTDPPIPADLAPISGGGKRRKRFTSLDEPAALDPIRFRYSTETIAEEQPIEETNAPEEKEPRQNRRSRRKPKAPQDEAKAEKKPQQPKAEKKAPEKKPQQPKKADPKPKAPEAKAKPAAEGQEKPAGEGQEKPKRNFRRHYRRRKPGQGGQGGQSGS